MLEKFTSNTHQLKSFFATSSTDFWLGTDRDLASLEEISKSACIVSDGLMIDAVFRNDGAFAHASRWWVDSKVGLYWRYGCNSRLVMTSESTSPSTRELMQTKEAAFLLTILDGWSNSGPHFSITPCFLRRDLVGLLLCNAVDPAISVPRRDVRVKRDNETKAIKQDSASHITCSTSSFKAVSMQGTTNCSVAALPTDMQTL